MVKLESKNVFLEREIIELFDDNKLKVKTIEAIKIEMKTLKDELLIKKELMTNVDEKSSQTDDIASNSKEMYICELCDFKVNNFS